MWNPCLCLISVAHNGASGSYINFMFSQLAAATITTLALEAYAVLLEGLSCFTLFNER
jgi:hypothetical protein